MLIGGKSLFRAGPAGPPGSTAAAALTDVVAGMKAVLTAANLPAARQAFGLTIGSAVQAWSATLDSLSALTTTAFGRSLLTQADAPTALTTLGAVPTARQISATAGGGLQGGGALVSDLVLAIAPAGVTNAMLAQAPAYTLKANLLAGTASPQDVGLSALIDATFGNTRGALLYRGASGWALLAPGSNGQVLTSNGSGADPGYAAVAAAASYPNVAVFNGLTVKPGSTAGTQIALAAAAVLLKGTSAGLPLQNVSATISTGTVGANGLDTGTLAASTWYAIHAIAKADGTFAGLLSLSATAPTLPSGYTYAARASWARTDASKNLIPIVQTGRVARYKVDGGHTYPVVVSGSVGDVTNPTFQAVAVSGFAPSTAIGGLFATYASAGSNTIALLAPNSSYGGYNQGQSSGAPPPPINSNNGANSASGSTGQQTMHFEGANVSAACQANAGIVCLGWDDNLCS
ncbi:hypothetical protein [Methylobacterium sp. 1973]|uniref:hypothetical protein n=1 Tax=Methylobacterium sp. 1973 TaxID=3156421 RepID=UPI00339B4FEB